MSAPDEIPTTAFAVVYCFDLSPRSYNEIMAACRVVQDWCEYHEVDARAAIRDALCARSAVKSAVSDDDA